MFAKGLANPPSPPSWLFFAVPLAANGFSLGKDRFPSPALCSAILVPILFRKDMIANAPVSCAMLVRGMCLVCVYVYVNVVDCFTVERLRGRNLRRADKSSGWATYLQCLAAQLERHGLRVVQAETGVQLKRVAPRTRLPNP